MAGRFEARIAVSAALLMAAGGGFAQAPGQATYKAKCQMCHGASGMADSGAGKAMNVKPITDADVKKMSEEEMIAATKNGMGKMKPFKDSLSETEIKDAVGYFRTFLK